MKKFLAIALALVMVLGLFAGCGKDKEAAAGLASAAASALDAMKMSVVLGTLAGDDTVMVVMRDINSAAAFCGEIKSLMQ